MTAVVLFVRSREIPAGVLWAVAAMTAVAWFGTGDSPHAVTTAALALALGVAVVGHSLGGPDSTLDRTAAIRWVPRRALHLATIFVVAASVVTAVSPAPAGVILRDAAGFTGLAALAATLLGRRLAWTLPVVTGCVSAGIPAVPEPFALHLLTWAGQQADSRTAFAAAAVLTLAGVTGYVTHGPSRSGDVS
ncbi:hypothetical protein [Actinoplanes sp. G11-F43]|uniref:hypothetical protein n=1 Tax=Actinoplanes sp. G11-F43 TaxID=3424130 RepID=UPI003D33500A